MSQQKRQKIADVGHSIERIVTEMLSEHRGTVEKLAGRFSCFNTSGLLTEVKDELQEYRKKSNELVNVLREESSIMDKM